MRKILIVDDNHSNLKLMREILSINNCNIVEASDGVESVVVAIKERPDLILMDIQMPEMDGIEALKQIRLKNDLKHIPVIAVTAAAMEGDKENFLSYGFNDCVTKPFAMKDLLEAVNKYLKLESTNV